MLTPIRVRGKNRRDLSGRSLCESIKLSNNSPTATTLTTGEKSRPGRPLKLPARLTDDASITSGPSLRPSSPYASPVDPSIRTVTALEHHRHDSRAPQLSHLERLPLELLQFIFVLSDNLLLPLVSPMLALSLSSRHVYTALCNRAFPAHTIEHDDSDLQSAVLRQPWFTLGFLEAVAQRRGVKGRTGSALEFRSARIPARLVCAPWTEEKIEMLERLLAYNARVDWLNTTTGEKAEQGMRDAILEGRIRAVRLLLCENVGVRVSTELLKLAVFRGGCKRDIVMCLISRGMAHEKVNGPGRIDWEDAELWRFALHQCDAEVGGSRGDDGDSKSGWGWLASLLERASMAATGE